MALKTCPSCGEEVPVVALRCKSCFYDFNEEPEARESGTMGLLVLFAAMALVGMGVFYYLHTQVAAERVVVEEETQTIIITRKSAAKTEATRIEFADITRVEYVLGGETATYEIVAVTGDGNRYVVKASDDSPLDGHAEQVARTVEKPLERVKNVRTFVD
ncbi:MAG: hypothetical protein VX944_06225 [Myxococcota bacterium]|nr:hypothetical protein [Myxococcota bacterium]